MFWSYIPATPPPLLQDQSLHPFLFFPQPCALFFFYWLHCAVYIPLGMEPPRRCSWSPRNHIFKENWLCLAQKLLAIHSSSVWSWGFVNHFPHWARILASFIYTFHDPPPFMVVPSPWGVWLNSPHSCILCTLTSSKFLCWPALTAQRLFSDKSWEMP